MLRPFAHRIGIDISRGCIAENVVILKVCEQSVDEIMNRVTLTQILQLRLGTGVDPSVSITKRPCYAIIIPGSWVKHGTLSWVQGRDVFISSLFAFCHRSWARKGIGFGLYWVMGGIVNVRHCEKVVSIVDGKYVDVGCGMCTSLSVGQVDC